MFVKRLAKYFSLRAESIGGWSLLYNKYLRLSLYPRQADWIFMAAAILWAVAPAFIGVVW
jgi:hypothetical protein